MKPYKIYILFLTLSLFTLNACEDFEELEKNPNRPVNAPASLVFNGILNDLYEAPWNDVQRWNQYWVSNYAYYDNQEYTWTSSSLSYNTLKNVQKMEEEAKRSGASDLNPYAALGKYFRAYFFVNMTQRVGDIPMQEALQGLKNIAPKYDTQKEVYLQSLTWLEEANDELTQLIATGDKTLAGDIYLSNDLSKWQKVINSFKLRVLISLSKKEADPELAIKTKFAQVLSNPVKYPIMTSMADNMTYVYNSTTNKYPFNPDEYGKTATRNNMAATYLNTLASLKDPRTFEVAEPAPAKIAAGLKATDYEAYVGASSGESLDDMSTKSLKGEYSFIKKSRYYGSYTGEPTIQIGYPEVCFNIAEAINRGWVTGNAAEYYQNGITASMSVYGITDIAVLNTYLTQPAISYAGNNIQGLNQILTQKYLAFFQNSGWEAFYNHRRTGIPTFLVGPGTGNSERIPKRWQYPRAEYSTNKTNLTEALQRQFGSEVDDINMDLWLLK